MKKIICISGILIAIAGIITACIGSEKAMIVSFALLTINTFMFFAYYKCN